MGSNHFLNNSEKLCKYFIISDTRWLVFGKEKKVAPKHHICEKTFPAIRETTMNLHRPSSEELPTLLLILHFNVLILLFIFIYIDILDPVIFRNLFKFHSQGYSFRIVCVCVCVCIYICVCVCVYVCIHTHTHTPTNTHTNTYAFILVLNLMMAFYAETCS